MTPTQQRQVRPHTCNVGDVSIILFLSPAFIISYHIISYYLSLPITTNMIMKFEPLLVLALFSAVLARSEVSGEHPPPPPHHMTRSSNNIGVPQAVGCAERR